MPSKILLIDVIFSLTIFSLLAYTICSLLKQYLIPFLRDQVKQEREAQTNLIEKENLIISNQHKIETQIRQQHRLFLTLEKNMQNWHQFLLEQKNANEDEYKKINSSVNEKRKTQQKNYTTVHICQEALPNAVELAEQELKTKYATKNGLLFFNNLIEKLSSRT